MTKGSQVLRSNFQKYPQTRVKKVPYPKDTDKPITCAGQKRGIVMPKPGATGAGEGFE